MCVSNTPLEWDSELRIFVKHEELCCPGGPNFSKTRGVYSHVASRPEEVIGVLDTSHSQGGWAVAKACKLLGKQCVLFYPVRKAERNAMLKPQQLEAKLLGARLVALPAGRSAILYHAAKQHLWELTNRQVYMMPNALKLPESVDETASELARTTIPAKVRIIVVSASSGTIAAGLARGLALSRWKGRLIIHMGYSRPEASVMRYIAKMSGAPLPLYTFIDEGYNYSDEARPGVTPRFNSNLYYDLKSLRWLHESGYNHLVPGTQALLWNIG